MIIPALTASSIVESNNTDELRPRLIIEEYKCIQLAIRRGQLDVWSFRVLFHVSMQIGR